MPSRQVSGWFYPADLANFRRRRIFQKTPILKI